MIGRARPFKVTLLSESRNAVMGRVELSIIGQFFPGYAQQRDRPERAKRVCKVPANAVRAPGHPNRRASG
jgi:hypothetical protein